MKLIWNFQRGGGGGFTNNPFRGGIMDIFLNYTLLETEHAENLLHVFKTI